MKSVQKPQKTKIQRSNQSITELPGLSHQNQSQLQGCGITTTSQLHQKTRTLEQRLMLASQLKIHISYIHKWAALADLAGIPSIGCQYCGLLLHSGIASVTQLAKISLHQLHQQVLRFQVTTLRRSDLCPPVALMQLWIQQAQLFQMDFP